MMRCPTPLRDLLAWHQAAIAGGSPPIHDGHPHCGWFKRRMHRDAPWVPARIFIERDIDELGELTGPETYVLEVNGIRQGNVADQWTFLTPISKAEFDHLTDYRLRDSRMFDEFSRVDLSERPTLPQENSI